MLVKMCLFSSAFRSPSVRTHFLESLNVLSAKGFHFISKGWLLISYFNSSMCSGVLPDL